ncbi:hypothetical protein KJN74_01210 [Candidatus Bathyarchaeota archaeon]|nr:hypothetical protein [Candidatus Bathyarchaeota archaeon]
MVISITTKENFFSPQKFGLIIVVVAFFMFTLHGLLTMEWWGEWEYFSGSTRFWIFVTDISSAIGLIVRFVGSLLAVIGIFYYFLKKGLSTPTTYKLIKIILVMEAIYWFTFITSGIWGITPILDSFFGDSTGIQGAGTFFNLSFVLSTGIPCLFESIAIPIALFKIIPGLSLTKAKTRIIKWSMIAGTFYIFTWWLNNAGVWYSAITSRGTEYLTAYPQNMVSFVFTLFGLLILGIFSAYFTKKSIGTEKLGALNQRTIGLILVVAGFYFLWNYLNWFFFGTLQIWSGGWYAWFLGHNLDLWALSLPLLGLPLLFKKDS